MGVAVSGWQLARAVSKRGQLGVVSGTALDIVLARRLQIGDEGGHVRRALGHFPVAGVAERILKRYFISGGKSENKPFRSKPMQTHKPSRRLEELRVAANFVEVFLAKEGHANPVGINYLEKIQAPTLPSLFGAMLAGVDFVLMGAGIPRAIPGILDQLAKGEDVELRLDVAGADRGEEFTTVFSPASFLGGPPPMLARPYFLAIVSSATLASMLARKASGRVDGFVIEGPTAGGHNAPPRGRPEFSESGEPVYGKRDTPDLEAFKEIGLPFWLAGSFGRPSGVAEALRLGAAGVQVGTAFAFCSESGIDPDLKSRVLAMSRKGRLEVFTDPKASPTGFPFKVVGVPDTLSEEDVYARRTRRCDLGYLRQAFKNDDGSIDWRCAGEPLEDFVRKGGDPDETIGRKCICNGLLATIGLAQIGADGLPENSLLTSGDDVAGIAQFLRAGASSYTANDVIDKLLEQIG